MTPSTWSLRDVARFWGKVRRVDGDGCWEYTGARQRRADGSEWYGVFGIVVDINGKRVKRKVLAHRFAWLLKHGSLDPSINVCHRCDNPICVRVTDHLFTGSQRDNLRDMRRKGRGHTNSYPPGEEHPKARVGVDDVHAIRRDFGAGVSVYRLSARYGIHPSTVHDIATGNSWKSVPWLVERPAPRPRVIRSPLASGKSTM